MNMLPSHTLRQPPSHASTLAPVHQDQAPAADLRVAMTRLIWLTLYVTLMRLLGYRIRRDPTPRTPRPAPLTGPAPAKPRSPAHPRRRHRYIDRQMCLGVLAGINAPFDAANPQAAPAPTISKPHTRATAQSRLRGRSAAPTRGAPSSRSHPLRRATPRPHPPPLSKPGRHQAPTRAHFVTIS